LLRDFSIRSSIFFTHHVQLYNTNSIGYVAGGAAADFCNTLNSPE
jgi:hypothetical protein